MDRVDVDSRALIDARLAANMTQHDLAVAIGVSGGAVVSKWERGEQQPRPAFIGLLAQVLRVKVIDLQPLEDRLNPDLRALRIRAALSLALLSRESGIPVRTLGDWEGGLGKRTIAPSDLQELARALGRQPKEVEDAIVCARQRRAFRHANPS